MAGDTKIPTATPTSTPAGGQLDLVARLGAQKSKFKNAFKLAQTKSEAMEKENADLRTQLAAASSKADSSASARRVLELEGKLREIDHRKVFDRVAKDKGVSEDSFELLYQVSGYKAEAPEADEAAIGALIDEQRAKPGVGRLFGQPGNNGPIAPNGTAPPPAPKPGAGSGKGGHHQAPFSISDEQQSDVKYVWANFDRIAESAAQRVQSGQI